LGGTNYSGPKKRINRKARDAPMLLRSRYRARARCPASRAKAIRRHLRSRLFCHSNRYPPTNGQSSITTTSTSTIRYNATIGDRSDVRQQLSHLQREQSEDLQFADRSRCGQFGCGRLLATRSGSRGDTRNRRRLGGTDQMRPVSRPSSCCGDFVELQNVGKSMGLRSGGPRDRKRPATSGRICGKRSRGQQVLSESPSGAERSVTSW
jgi:hypothetical protein